MIKYIKGDLLALAEQGQFDAIVHGCNCFNTMGAGIAKQIADKYPQAMLADDATVRGDCTKLGNWTVSHANVAGFAIINAYTQYNFSDGKTDVFEYDSFSVILRKLAMIHSDIRYGFPYIGMGLARGDKGRIIALLEDFSNTIANSGGSCTLVEYA